MKQQSRVNSGGRAWGAVTIAAAAVLVVGGLTMPWPLTGYASQRGPGYDYAQAVEQAQGLDGANAGELSPVCRTLLLTHGSKTQRAMVLVHGYTSCPEQFHALGTQLYDLGYNVLIAPLPHHGLADRMTDEISLLSAAELAAYSDRVVDIAHGLGDEVDMMGLSAGGVVTSWAAQNRSDLDLAVVISPAFGFKQIPTALTTATMNAMSMLPEAYTWWDPRLQLKTEPAYAYPRYSVHALMQIMRLGFAVDREARQGAPGARRIVVVTNGNEPSVNNAMTEGIVQEWQAHGANIGKSEFPASLGLPHDLIDPNQPDEQVGVVYPALIGLVGR